MGRSDPVITRETAFGRNLRRLRKASGLLVSQLADLVGVTPKVIYMWEKGEREPHWPFACRVAAYFGVSLDEFTKDGE